MACLLIRTVNGENAQRYMDGDVVMVRADDHVFGRMESLKVWLAEGRKAEHWPGGFAVVRLDGLSVEEATAYLEEKTETVIGVAIKDGEPEFAPMERTVRRRNFTLDYQALERRSPGSGRDTLRTEKDILRRFDEVSDKFSRKADP